MKIKFCGITNLEDARDAISLNIDYLGFVVDFPKSPRSVSIEKFINIVQNIKEEKKRFKIVAVVVNMPEKKIDMLLTSGLVGILQFHGDETPEFCDKYKKQIEVWKAFKLTGDLKKSLSEIEKFRGKIDKFLIDASSAEDKISAKRKQYNFQDFELFKILQKKKYQLILAGGLNPENVQEYVKKLNPAIIDAASGIEKYPGKKSKAKMKKFILSLRGGERA
ncbi:phosphoribosylanthranilate isomerase [Candidatus Parcubacteria bacterium]|nr:phosphoribosylanthranilate isomerase [Candidatus Parcubacteria bacterium]